MVFDDTGGEVNNVTITNNTLQNNATGLQIGATGYGDDANYIVANFIIKNNAFLGNIANK